MHTISPAVWTEHLEGGGNEVLESKWYTHWSPSGIFNSPCIIVLHILVPYPLDHDQSWKLIPTR